MIDDGSLTGSYFVRKGPCFHHFYGVTLAAPRRSHRATLSSIALRADDRILRLSQRGWRALPSFGEAGHDGHDHEDPGASAR
jgi:hypothetical protein